MHTLTFATSTQLIQQALQQHEPWIRSRLGAPLEETVFLRTPLVFTQLALTLLGQTRLAEPQSTTLARLAGLLETVVLPPGVPPLVEVSGRTAGRRSKAPGRPHPWALTWQQCPVALGFRGLSAELIALRVIRFGERFEPGESVDDLLLLRRDRAEEVAAFLERLLDRREKPELRVLGEAARPVAPCQWGQLTLAEEVRTLLQQDFEAFFRDREWYEQMKIPHRRGYLLHGPPGNGKTSAVRAMLTSRGLTAYSLRLSGKHTEDSSLEQVFEEAAANSPSVVLLEDVDRAFPRSGGTQCKVSLQTLLNALDGVASEPGVIAVATANEPRLLDPAILRRPGRFDRVIHFGDPDAGLRRAYFEKAHAGFAGPDLIQAVEATAGFSFALMQECYILAAQTARSAQRPPTAENLAASATVLRRSYRLAEDRGGAAGFVA